MAKNQKKSLAFSALKGIVRFFYPKMELVGTENLPEGEAILVGNHAQIHGPIVSELYFEENCAIWCAGEMMRMREVPAYAFQDFWSAKPPLTRPFYKVLSYLIAPLAAFVFTRAKTIPVRRDNRIITTFRTTIKRMQEGAKIVIFPEENTPYNHILSDFQEHFVDVARLYHKTVGKEVEFVPFYVSPHCKRVVFGKPIRFSAKASMEEERERIITHLMQEITCLAESLPLHTVIPYQNKPKKEYNTNLPKRS